MNYFLQIPVRLLLALLNLAQGANLIIQRQRPQVEAVIYAQLSMFAIAMVFMCGGVMFNLSFLVTYSAIAIAFIFFISWCLPDLIIELTAKITGKIPVVGCMTEDAAKEMRRLLRPMLSVSTIFAFIACWVSIRGINRYSARDIFILGSFMFFVWLFLFYIESKTRWAGYVEFAVLTVLIVSTYFFPVQVKSYYCWAERHTIHRSVQTEIADLDLDMVNIPANVTCYGKKGDEFQAIGKAGDLGFQNDSSIVKAKVLDRDDDPSSKEAVYKVQLPLEEDLFIGGKIVYVPCRKVTATVKEEKKEAAPVNTSSIPAPVAQPAPQAAASTTAHYGEPDRNNVRCIYQTTDTPLDAGVGKTTAFWINPIGKRAGFATNNRNFTVVTETGEKYDFWKPADVERFNKSHLPKFYCVNQTNTPIDLTTRIMGG